MEDRRRAPRVELRAAGIVNLGDYEVPCEILDVSDTGLALVTHEPAPLRAIRVRFQLGREAAWTEVEGQVVRTAELDERSDTQLWGVARHRNSRRAGSLGRFAEGVVAEGS